MLVAVACTVMYAMAATHWIRMVHYLFLNKNNAIELQNETVYCLSNITDGQACDLSMDRVFDLIGPGVDSCSESAELLVTVSEKDNYMNIYLHFCCY